MPTEFISILMLTHNAPDYVKISIESLRACTRDVNYELVIVDNASHPSTVKLVQDLYAKGEISTLILNPQNSLFSGGNNIAARAAHPDANYFLLLNSDVEIRDPYWLRHIIDIHKRGITTYGIVPDDMARVDGYCLLIDADLYRKNKLDEGHNWWWGVTKLQAELLCEGYHVQGYFEHDIFLHHFGGKSGSSFTKAQGMNVSRKTVESWFGGHLVKVLDPAKLRRYKFRKLLDIGAIRRKLGRLRAN